MRPSWKVIVLILSCVLPVAGICNQVVVSQIGIMITGEILPSSCTINTSKSTSTVAMGYYPSNTMTAIGKVFSEKKKPISIFLTGCNPGIIGTVVTLSGAQDGDDPTLLALSNPQADDTAKGVAIQLSDDAGNIIPVNKASVLQKLVAGDNTVKFYLAYEVTKVPVTAGNANSVLYLDMVYQ